MKNERISGPVMVFSLLSASILLYWGIVLEGDEHLRFVGSDGRILFHCGPSLAKHSKLKSVGTA
jgi:hypothetical protein